MRRNRASSPFADTAADAPVRVLTQTGAESEIRFGVAPPPDAPDSDDLAVTTGERDANPQPRPSLRDRSFRLRRTAADILVFALIVVAAFAIWPVRLGGATSYIIIKGNSMEPKFHTGDLAVVRKQDSYRKGDIVAYRIPARSAGAGHLVIHRIIGRSHGGYLMQGDNRTTPDSWYPKPTDVLGRFRLLVPLPGIQFWALMPWVCCAAIGIAVAWMLWPRTRPESTGSDEDCSHTDPVGRALAESSSAPVEMGARRLRRIERDSECDRSHTNARRRGMHRSTRPVTT